MTTRVAIVNFGPLPVTVKEHGPLEAAQYSEQTIQPGQIVDFKYVHSGQKITIIEETPS